MNTIYFVEKNIQNWISCNVEPSQDEIWKVGELLGQPTRKREVVIKRYSEIFNRLIVKNCVEIGENDKVCIYTWNPRAYIRYFPVTLHATGTILRFKGYCDVDLLAYPIHRSFDPEVKGVTLPTSEVPVETTKRVDGWQVTAYYDPILKRWMFATKYVLHNMYYERGRLVVEEYGNIVNPYVEMADAIASSTGLYEKLKGHEGWTFTFTLVGPEPAITKPPPPILMGDYLDKYKLLLVVARKPNGQLLSVRESGELLDWETVPIIDTKESIGDLAVKAERSLDTRSYMVRLGGDLETPPLYELKSKYYPEAMRFKFLYDAKSYTILATSNLSSEALRLVDDENVKSVIKEIDNYIEIYREVLSRRMREGYDDLETMFTSDNVLRRLVGDLRKARSTGSIDRLLRKLLAVILDGKSVFDAKAVLEEYLNVLK